MKQCTLSDSPDALFEVPVLADQAQDPAKSFKTGSGILPKAGLENMTINV